MENEGRIWFRYTDKSGNKRYVCAYEANNIYVDVESDIHGPPAPCRCWGGCDCREGSFNTGISGIPKQKNFLIIEI